MEAATSKKTKPRRPRARGSAIRRAFQLTKQLVRGAEFDRHTAASVLDVEPAAAARHLAAAAEVLELRVTNGATGRMYSMPRPGRVAKDGVQDRDIVALCLGAALAPIFQGSSYESGMRAARDTVARASRKGRKDLNRKFGFVPRGGESALPDAAGELDEIIDALLREETISAKYMHFDGRIEKLTLSPLTLLVYEHQLYVVAFEKDVSDVRPYRFSRLTDVDRGDPFRYPPALEYDPDTFFQESFGIFLNHEGKVERVVVQLTPRWSTHVRTHRWHSSQRVIKTPAGPRVQLRVRVCPELIAWVRSFGPEAAVVAPDSLRTAVDTGPTSAG